MPHHFDGKELALPFARLPQPHRECGTTIKTHRATQASHEAHSTKRAWALGLAKLHSFALSMRRANCAFLFCDLASSARLSSSCACSSRQRKPVNSVNGMAMSSDI